MVHSWDRFDTWKLTLGFGLTSFFVTDFNTEDDGLQWMVLTLRADKFEFIKPQNGSWIVNPEHRELFAARFGSEVLERVELSLNAAVPPMFGDGEPTPPAGKLAMLQQRLEELKAELISVHGLKPQTLQDILNDIHRK